MGPCQLLVELLLWAHMKYAVDALYMLGLNHIGRCIGHLDPFGRSPPHAWVWLLIWRRNFWTSVIMTRSSPRLETGLWRSVFSQTRYLGLQPSKCRTKPRLMKRTGLLCFRDSSAFGGNDKFLSLCHTHISCYGIALYIL